MTAASCQFGSMNDTTLPAGIRAISVFAIQVACSFRVLQSSRMSPSTSTVRCGVVRGGVAQRVGECRRAPTVRAGRRRLRAARRPAPSDLTLDPAHGHGMPVPRRGMRVDRDLGDLAVRRLVGALHLQRGGARFDLQRVRQFRSDRHRGDLLMHLDDADPEQVLDQREDRP